MSTQQGSSLVWQARIRHTDRNRVAASVGELLLVVYRRACGLTALRSARFNPQSLSFRVAPHTPGEGQWVPRQVNLYAPSELQSDDRIMWRVQAQPPADPTGADQEWPEIGQVYWNLVDDTIRCMAMPADESTFASRRPLERRPIRARWDHDFFWAGLTDEMVGWVRQDDRAGVIMGDGANRLIVSEGAGREHVGRIREIIRQYEHFPMLPPRVRAQGLRMLAQGTSRNSQRVIDTFHEFMASHHPMDLDRIEGWVVERLIVLGHYTSDEIREPEARASAIQAAMIRNNIREFDDLTRLGLSCLARARVRNDRATRYGSPTTSRNPCAEIVLPPEPEPDEQTRQEVLRNGWADAFERQHGLIDMRDVRAQGEPINERPIPAGTRVTIDPDTGMVREAREGEYTFGIATGRSTADGRIEITTNQGTFETPMQQDPERIRGLRSNTIVIDDSEAGLDQELVRQILGSGDAVPGQLTREVLEEAMDAIPRIAAEREQRQRDVENTRRAKRQQELKKELARVLSQMFDPTVDDGAMPAADMALVHLRYRLHAMLTAAPVGRLEVDVDWNNDQALDAVIKDPQNGNVELSRIRMDASGDFVRDRLPEAEVGVGERAIDL